MQKKLFFKTSSWNLIGQRTLSKLNDNSKKMRHNFKNSGEWA